MKKTIFLVDMNAFFISCEMTRNPSLVGKPSAVAGDPKKRTGIILAANYEARAFGVKTAMVLYEALRLCPGLTLVPPDHSFYEKKSSEVMNLLSDYTLTLEQTSVDEAFLDMTGMEQLFGRPIDSSKIIMNEIKDKLNLWCSIGISENKFLAKMASEMKKPLGITELWKSDIPEKLWPLPISYMHGVGEKTAEKLKRLNIQTIGDLARMDIKLIDRQLGKLGSVIHSHANGIDNETVVPNKPGDMKSIGRSATLPEDVSDIERAKTVLLELADDIGMTTRKYCKKGRTVQITLKYTDFQSVTRQMTVPLTNSTSEIYHAGIKLLEQNWNCLMPVRLIGISLTGFDTGYEVKQLSIFDIIEGPEPKNSKQEQIDKTMDKIREKHGAKMISRASLIKKGK